MKRYNSYSDFLRSKFGSRVQKISIDAGFSCPNRDGTKGIGGCTYCNNQTFSPYYCESKRSITDQLKEGSEFFGKKYQPEKYLAYFQSYTNTYTNLEHLKQLYEEALSFQGVVGLVISTRPDCIDAEKLDYLKKINQNYFVSIEFGIETTLNKTLQLINRCHTWEESEKAILETSKHGIHTGVHMILGLPSETNEDMLNHIDKLSLLPVNSIKFHQLQIIQGTKLHFEYMSNPERFNLFQTNEYISLICKIIERLNPKIMIDRFVSESPAELLIAPKWGQIKNFEIVHKIENELNKLSIKQGQAFR